MKSPKQLLYYLYRLEEANCKLFDVSGKEWTSEDDATEINAWVSGKASNKGAAGEGWTYFEQED